MRLRNGAPNGNQTPVGKPGTTTTTPLLAAERIERADAYLNNRTGKYQWRCERYDAALTVMHAAGLSDSDTVLDVGAGMGEFGCRLHTGAACLRCTPGSRVARYADPIHGCRARYWPIDAALDGTDLETWTPPRTVEWIVALELVEHLQRPFMALARWMPKATKGVILSTPNPLTVDVLAIDATHVTPVHREPLEVLGFHVEARQFYGQPDDSLLAVWTPPLRERNPDDEFSGYMARQ